MKKHIKWIAALVAFALLIAGAYFLYDKFSKDFAPDTLSSSSQSSETESTDVSYAAPDFTVIDANGNKVKLSDFKGKPVVVNFWASWCPPCKAEMPDFNEAYKNYGDIQFMMVNMTDGSRETVETAKAHIKSEGYEFPVFYDTEYSAAIAYNATSLPATYFVDKDGNLVTYAIGMLDANSLKQGIEMLLE